MSKLAGKARLEQKNTTGKLLNSTKLQIMNWIMPHLPGMMSQMEKYIMMIVQMETFMLLKICVGLGFEILVRLQYMYWNFNDLNKDF